MKASGTGHRALWPIPDRAHAAVGIIDQTRLPHAHVTAELDSAAQVAQAIRLMQVRGAPLIGIAGAYGLALAMQADPSDAALAAAYDILLATRPTAVNLRWALDRVRALLARTSAAERFAAAWDEAGRIAAEDVEINRAIGTHGARLIADIHRTRARPGRPVDVLTHCNTGWIATADYGTALSAVYQAFEAGTPLHVWVSETRPRNQGLLTAWELGARGVAHTLLVDSASGYLLQQGRVDLVLVGADRVSRNGDVCNKIGTYLKALAAYDNRVPFYVCVPSPTIDWQIDNCSAVQIEERDPNEVRTIVARAGAVALVDERTAVANPAFDITPARLITGIITEHGVVAPDQLETLFSERRGR